MKTIIILLIHSSLIVLIGSDRLTKDELTKGEEVIRTVPDKERTIFLAYTLGQGYMIETGYRGGDKYPFPILQRIPKKLQKKFQAMQKPKYFDTNLYRFVAGKYNLDSRQMFKLALRKKLCFPRGKCVDLENIGEMCCPF